MAQRLMMHVWQLVGRHVLIRAALGLNQSSLGGVARLLLSTDDVSRLIHGVLTFSWNDQLWVCVNIALFVSIPNELGFCNLRVLN